MATTPRIDRLEKNLIINGNFDFWQRTTSVLVNSPGVNTGYKSADRWFNWSGAINHNITFSRQTGERAQFCMRVQRNSGVSVTSNAQLAYTAEIADARMFAGKKITLQFRARKGANYSPANSNLESNIYYGSGTSDANIIMAGFTGSVVTTQNNTLTSAFQTFSMSVTLPANATQLAVTFRMDTVGTAGAADYFEIEQVMVTVGDLKEDFCRAGRNYAEELQLCQRYYEKSYNIDILPGAINSVGESRNGVALPGTSGLRHERFLVTKRSTPTLTIYSSVTGASGFYNYEGSGDLAINTPGEVGHTGFTFIPNNGQVANAIQKYQWVADAEI